MSQPPPQHRGAPQSPPGDAIGRLFDLTEGDEVRLTIFRVLSDPHASQATTSSAVRTNASTTTPQDRHSYS